MYNLVNLIFRIILPWSRIQRVNSTLIGLIIILSHLLSTFVFAKEPGYYRLGRLVTTEEIAGWDIDVRPDGAGLPPGSGSVVDGEVLYEEKCAVCHGSFGEGEGRWPMLAGGIGTLTDERPEKTIGSYWPYASTLWDYTRRAMPFNAPQSLSDNEVYAISAYIFYLNDIVAEDFVLTHNNLAKIEMPNKDGFFVDPRPDVKNPLCMKDCKDPKTIKITSAIKGITPLAHLFKNNEKNKTSHSDLSTPAKQGTNIYNVSCSSCHGPGSVNAPKTGNKEDWEKRIDNGISKLVEHAINGYSGDIGLMPARGGNNHLTDEEVTSAVIYIIEQSR